MLTSELINTRAEPLFLIGDSYLSGPAGFGEMWSLGLGLGGGGGDWSLLLNVLWTVPDLPGDQESHGSLTSWHLTCRISKVSFTVLLLT